VWRRLADPPPGPHRIGVAFGLVEVVEGELVGRPLFEAHALMRAAAPGEVRCAEVMETILSGGR
jgi:hypothetical protein